MIVGLEGKVRYKEPSFVHLDVNGVIYEVFISLQTFSSLDDEIKLFISHIMRENMQTLYGFLTKTEKALFEKLIKISGVGPKVAMAICSTYTPSQFAQLISANDVNAIKKVPGIGPKSAKRIIMQMCEFNIEISNPLHNQAANALESLGFNKADILKALNGLDGSLEDIIKEALKRLSK